MSGDGTSGEGQRGSKRQGGGGGGGGTTALRMRVRDARSRVTALDASGW